MRAVLAEPQVVRARELVRAGTATAAQIARDWQVNANAVRHAVDGTSWQQLNAIAPPVTSAPGERSRRTLNPEIVADARARVRDGSAKIADVAAEAGVPYNTMWSAVTGSTWTVVDVHEPPVARNSLVQRPALNTLLSEERVADARRRYVAGESFAAIASSYGASESTVMAAVHGRTWRHVQDPPPVPCGTPGRALLPPEQVERVQKLAGQLSRKEIAAQMGVHESTVSRIITGSRRGTATAR